MSQSLESNAIRKSVENQPSETAMATAMMRALAAHDERDEIRGADYLAGQTVDRTLMAIRSVSLPGSSIAFDYASISAETLGEEGVRRLREHMKTRFESEPTKFGIREGTLRLFLSERGYSLIVNLTPQDMEASFLTRHDGALARKVSAMFHLVHAEVAPHFYPHH